MEGSLLDGRYRLRRRIGAGGMASVWEARDETLGRDVAVKVLSDVLAGDPAYRRRFEREARVAAAVSHPGLVAIHDFGADGERPYLVMELVRGETLADRIARNRSGLDVVALAQQLLDALGHIHTSGIVHRDVKPANVLLGPDGRARLTDFGIAQPDDATALTQTGQVIGTLRYMAPEVRGGGRATPRSDLYALGVLLGECGGRDDPVLAPLVDRLTARVAEDRPASTVEAASMLDAYRAAAAGGASHATAPTATMPMPPRRRPVVLALALAAVAAVLALGVVLVATDDDREPPPASTRTAGAAPAGRDASGPSSAQSPSTQGAPPASNGTQSASCAAIEQQKKAIEREKDAAERAAGDDKEAKEALKKQFEARKKDLEERANGC